MSTNLRTLRIAVICIPLLSHAHVTFATPPGLAAVLKGTVDSSSESGSPTMEQATTSENALPEKRAVVQEQLRVAQQTLRQSDEDATASSSAETDKLGLLKQLDLVYAQQESTLARTKELESARAEAKRALQELQENGPQEPKPYSFFLQESLQDALASQREQLKSVSATIESVTQSAARAKEALDAKEKQRRLVKQKVASNSDAGTSGEVSATYEFAKQESNIALAKLEIRKAELVNIKLEEETLQIQIQFHLEKLQRIAHEVTFSEGDLKERLRELSKLESDITRRSKDNDAETGILLSEWGKARQRLDKSKRANESTQSLQAEVTARKFTHSLRSNRADYFTKQSTWVQRLRDVWKWRYRVATGEFDTSDLSKWRTEVDGLLEDISTEKALKDTQREELRKVLADGQRLISQDSDADINRWIDYQDQAIRDQIEFANVHVARIEDTARIANKLATEIRERTNHFSVAEWASVVWDKVVFVWDYELTESEEDQPPLQVSSVVCGLLLLVLGYRFSRILSSLIGNKVLPRFGINDGGAAALQSLFFYALLFTSTLMALKVVSVPLTLFTFLGGAAAIGIGFGSQSILNNFISGLILLTEQPVRVGDLIELGGLVGRVESIGMRSTRVRTGSMQEIIIPNSSFLENNVVNWTLTDTTIRCNVDVGVAYGSPTRDVAKWLKRAADEHGLVMGKPEPFVWFAGFGDNSLNFELYFFIMIRTLSERRRIESDLRFMIDQYFRDAGISIAFPQRDLHLDTQRPLEVRMLSTGVASDAITIDEQKAA